MCGIAGFVDAESSAERREAAVRRMCAAMVHRGPDDAGMVTVGSATLGHRRLAVMDPAHAQQPMASLDRRFHVVFNGAIYNFRELRAELCAAGFSFRTDCDTEVLLAAYAQWGPQCVHRLRGMFAFAVWDAHKATLFLARDPFGIKPLYYRQEGSSLLFASELGALHDAGIFRPTIDPAAVAAYLGWLAVPAPQTIHREVLSLHPGSTVTFGGGRCVVVAQSLLPPTLGSVQACRSQAEFNVQLRSKLEDAIRAHVIADVPVGAFLSGGLDSAVITALMRRVCAGRLKTFTIGFNEVDLDESSAAAVTARHLGTEHSTRMLTGAELAADLPSVLAAMDQPTGDGINTFYASQSARAGGVVVALSGLGSDELFGGYPSFNDIPRLARWLPLWQAAPGAVRRRVLAGLNRQNTRTRKLADILERASNVNEICALQRRVFSVSQVQDLLSPDARIMAASQSAFHPELGTLTSELRDAGVFETISAWELRTYMADVLLRDSDVMSMRHSLELRTPFVDRPLIEWLWQQPSRFKADPARPKSALAAATADLLPAELLHRRKRGFTLPLAQWMRAELRPFLDETFSESSLDRSGLFAPRAVQNLWRRYLVEKDSRQWSRLWSLAVLVDFVNRPSRLTHAAGIRSFSNIAANLMPAGTDALLSPGQNSESQRSPAAFTERNTVATTDTVVMSMEPDVRDDLRASLAARPRRTLLLVPELFSAEGGIARMLQIYLKALCELATPEQSVQFLALNDRLVDTEELRRSSNARLTEWRVCSRQKSRFVRAALAMSRQSDRIICGHVAQLPVALLAKTFNPRLRYYLIAHGIEVWRPFTVAERLALRRAERVFCVSEYTRQELLRRCNLTPGRAVVLPNALDPAFASSASDVVRDMPPAILTVTRLTHVHRYKGVEHLIEAMPAIRASLPAAVLRIIGRGDDMGRLQQLRDKLGLQNAVQFLGYVDDQRIGQEMRRSSLFALPSSQEGFGLVFVEAMAHGLPCIGANAGGVPEIITPATGVLVEFGNVAALAQACADALSQTWDEAKIIERANEFSYSRFKERLAAALDH